MNKYYSYPDIDIWQDDRWQGKLGSMDALVQWMESNGKIEETDFVPPICEDPRKRSDYRKKTDGIDPPETTEYWAKKGIRYSSLEQGHQYWISLVPEQAFLDRENKLPMLIAFHYEDITDPWYTMKTMAYFKQYNEMLAEKKDFIAAYLINNEPDQDRIYVNVIQEASILYPVDLDNMYLDVSPILNQGMRLKDIPGFVYRDRDGEIIPDPDDRIENFGSLRIPVLPVGGCWGNADSLQRGLIMFYRQNAGTYDKEWFVHSNVAKRLTEPLLMENRFGSVDDPGFIEYWDAMGLQYDKHFTKGERWLTFVPKQAMENKEKLPVVLIMQEVYDGNAHLAVSSLSYFYEYLNIAAQGECMLLFFALEDWDSNDLLIDILDEAKEQYPVDAQRVYMTGHSHDGYFTSEFARRHPKTLAAIATLGNATAFITPEEWGEPILSVSDDRMNSMAEYDMPTINMTGVTESFAVAPKDNPKEQEKWAKFWQRRLIASRCPVKSIEEIIKATKSKNKAERIIGVPADHAETIWADGFEHYVVDITNVDGKDHLRIVSSENMPHTVTPFMIDFSWNYLRKFARDTETGQVIDLY